MTKNQKAALLKLAARYKKEGKINMYQAVLRKIHK
jgi:hypothetical protein